MMAAAPRQWMTDQLKPDHVLCLILDSEGELDVRQALLNTSDPDQHRSLYGETQVADLGEQQRHDSRGTHALDECTTNHLDSRTCSSLYYQPGDRLTH